MQVTYTRRKSVRFNRYFEIRIKFLLTPFNYSTTAKVLNGSQTKMYIKPKSYKIKLPSNDRQWAVSYNILQNKKLFQDFTVTL